MKVTILGAGLSGLSAAYHLKTNYQLFEAEAESGGLCRTVKENGYAIDYGPHLFFSKNEYVVKLLNTLLKNNLHTLESAVAQYSFGQYIRYPYNVNLYGAPVEVIKDCITGFVNTCNKRDKKKPANYRDWCLYHFGKGYAHHFMIPYAKKAWTIDPKKLTVDWIGRRIFLPTLEQVLEGALHESESMHNYIPTFRYPLHGGMSSMIEGFARRINKINLNKRVVDINVKSRVITFQDSTSLCYGKVISTIPLPEMVKMTPDTPASVRNAASRLKHNSILIYNIGVDRPNLSNRHWIYYDGNEPFHRIHFPDNLSKFNAPKGVGIVSVEIPYSRFQPLNTEDLYSRTLSKLIDAGILRSSDKIIYKNVTNLKYAYVIFDHHRKASVKRIRDYFRRHNIETCGRFGEWDYLWTDQSILSGKQAAERITKP